MLITSKLAVFGSIDFRTIFVKFVLAVLVTRIRKCVTFCAMPKKSDILLIVPKTAMITFVGEVDGTKCGKLYCYKHWALANETYKAPNFC